MKKKLISLLLVSALTITMCTGCGSKGKEDVVDPAPDQGTVEDPATPETPADTEDPTVTEPVENHDNDMRSELSNEWIPQVPANSRPIAMMIPNDKGALPHYNISSAAVIYQAPVEGSITRLMALFDNTNSFDDRTGNIRSARTYYVYWALEWDSLFIHFGNPWYADDILNSGRVAEIDYQDLAQGTEDSLGTENINSANSAGYWYRASDRRAPQNAYVSKDALELLLANRTNLSSTYTDSYQGAHFSFADEETPVDLSLASDAVECNVLDMEDAYPIDETYFEYDEATGKYLRYEFGEPHIDATTGEQLSFENIIVQSCSYYTLDEKGYLNIYFKSTDNDVCKGYYITNGYAIPITWEKGSDYAQTKYYDASGSEIVLNTGKTMVCVIKDDTSVSIS